MPLVPLLAFTVLLSATAVSSRDIAHMLAEAERIRETDKPKSRQLLDEVHRSLSDSSDPSLIAADIALAEEFLVVLHDAGAQVEQLAFPSITNDLRVTISVGV